MAKKPLGYQEKLKAIKNYTSLGINSKKYNAKNPNFSLREKKIITKYYNTLKTSGYFDYDPEEQVFIPKVKIVKSKKKKQKGSPRLNGYIVQGANPNDKIRGGKIIKGNYEKIFIPMDFSDLPVGDDDALDEVITEVVFDAITPYYEDLKYGDYFTIVLQNGWELGQRKGKAIEKDKRRDGQKIAEDLEGEDKFMNLVDKIRELIEYARNKYKMENKEMVTGIYLWKFTNQRKPNNKEKSVINKKKKGRKN